MGFHLEKEEESAAGIRRVLREQAEYLVADFGMEDREEAIHEARKRCKRIRAVARLLRFSAKPVYRRENRAFRNLARALSGMRDADAQLEAFRKLAKLEKNGAAHYTKLGELLQETAQSSSVRTQKQKLGVLAKKARVVRKRLDDLRLPEGRGFGLIEKGLGQSYKRGRKAMRTAFDQSEGAAFHEWRKRVKDLGHQIQLVRGLWSSVLKRIHRQLEELGDLLGEEHDLRMIREALLKNARKTVSPELLSSFFGLLERRAFELQTDAHAIGRRIYAERPRAFMKRMRAYWKTWQAEIPASRARAAAVISVRRSGAAALPAERSLGIRRG